MAADKTKQGVLERARRTSGYMEQLSSGDLTLRPFSVATVDHITSLELDALIPGSGKPAPKSDSEFINLIFGVAWTLWAPIEEVNEICLDLEFAEKAEKTRLKKEMRGKIIDFKSRVPIHQVKKLVQNLVRVLENLQTLDFDLINRDSAGEGEIPPGNS